MNITSWTTPAINGYYYHFIIPISVDNQSVSAIFGETWENADLFTQVAPDEFQFTGKFAYSPNNFKAFMFRSDIFPDEGGYITLRTASQDYSVSAILPKTHIPEPSFLFIVPLLLAAFMRKR